MEADAAAEASTWHFELASFGVAFGSGVAMSANATRTLVSFFRNEKNANRFELLVACVCAVC